MKIQVIVDPNTFYLLLHMSSQTPKQYPKGSLEAMEANILSLEREMELFASQNPEAWKRFQDLLALPSEERVALLQANDQEQW